MSEQHKAADRAVFEIWSTGELEQLDALVAPDVRHHDPYDRHASAGLEGMKQAILAYSEAFPDARFTVEDQIAEGDKVLTRWRSVGTHRDSLRGEEPTCKVVTCTGMVVERFEPGKVIEAWRIWDALALLSAIGVVSHQAPR